MKPTGLALAALLILPLSGCGTNVVNDVISMSPNVPTAEAAPRVVITTPKRAPGDLDKGVLVHSLALDPYIVDVQYVATEGSDPRKWKTDTGEIVSFKVSVNNLPDSRIVKVTSVLVSTLLDGQKIDVLEDSGEFVVGTEAAPNYQNSFAIPSYTGDVSSLKFITTVKFSIETFEKSGQYLRRSVNDSFKITLLPVPTARTQK